MTVCVGGMKDQEIEGGRTGGNPDCTTIEALKEQNSRETHDMRFLRRLSMAKICPEKGDGLIEQQWYCFWCTIVRYAMDWLVADCTSLALSCKTPFVPSCTIVPRRPSTLGHRVCLGGKETASK